MHIAYLAHWVPIVDTTGPGSLIYNLRAFASKPADFITVNDTEGINRALVSYTR